MESALDTPKLDFDFHKIPCLEWNFEDNSWRNSKLEKGNVVRVKVQYISRLKFDWSDGVLFFFCEEISHIHSMEVATCMFVCGLKHGFLRKSGVQVPSFFLEKTSTDEEFDRLKTAHPWRDDTIKKIFSVELTDPYPPRYDWDKTRVLPDIARESSYELDDHEICRALILRLERRLSEKIDLDNEERRREESMRAQRRREEIDRLERRYGRDYVHHQILRVGVDMRDPRARCF